MTDATVATMKTTPVVIAVRLGDMSASETQPPGRGHAGLGAKDPAHRGAQAATLPPA